MAAIIGRLRTPSILASRLREGRQVSRIRAKSAAHALSFLSAACILTNKFFNVLIARMLAVEVIDDPAAAVVALDPARSRLLSELAEPASAATLAGRLGIARQKINYHLRTLEEHQLVRVAEKRTWGGLTERLMVATASSYIVSPVAMGAVAADPGRSMDRLSASYLIALAARIVRE